MCGIFEDTELIKYDYDVSKWDVSSVWNFSEMFWGCKYFTGKGLENWKVSIGTDFQSMFYDYSVFDCDLGSWKIPKAYTISYMFYNCYEFKGKGLEKWDTHSIQQMKGTFMNCVSFDRNLSKWLVFNVRDMWKMFQGCKIFKGKGLDKWHPSKVSRRVICLWTVIILNVILKDGETIYVRLQEQNACLMVAYKPYGLTGMILMVSILLYNKNIILKYERY